MGSRLTPGGYRGRLAPSPTGLLHVGHASTFLTACTRATGQHGTLILRNDDLDEQRSRPDFYQAMLEDLRWVGIEWQEGPDVGGPCGPYSQSERHELYLAAWRRLLDSGFLYPCNCSRKDLALAASAPHESGDPGDDDEPMYLGTCRPPLMPAHSSDQNLPELSQSPSGNWRFRVPDGQTIEFFDQHFGLQQFIAGRDFGDFLVWRRDGVPSYQLACVVDDDAMRITEVVRGGDLLKSTARQILLYRALELKLPSWYHCALVTDEKGERLAKRHDSLSIRALREQGKSPRDLLSAMSHPSGSSAVHSA